MTLIRIRNALLAAVGLLLAARAELAHARVRSRTTRRAASSQDAEPVESSGLLSRPDGDARLLRSLVRRGVQLFVFPWCVFYLGAVAAAAVQPPNFTPAGAAVPGCAGDRHGALAAPVVVAVRELLD